MKNFAKKIWIVDFGSQYTQLITRKTRELGFSSEIISLDDCHAKFSRGELPECLILSGGPQSVFEDPFDYSFIFPATSDRVPTIFIENENVVGLQASDPIEVDYKQKTGTEPTGLENPELLKLKASPNHGHNNTIVNGIGRIGYMSGGKQARWTDEEVAHVFVDRMQIFF